ncbi:MAG: glutamine synthetase family protein [Gemmiger sp.]|uniref:glutamine synthetase family protein n=1 Tax=Gemmiger sp. TaxID=2049027 RepID=UPI002E79661E|nr:glutamine synthetase family protein [Gemmiger sp.]MEE0800510.1 glutamine synthetase family protein [Gemmiger sp.]
MKHTAQDILNYVEDNDVKFVRLAFCDIFGNQKNISVYASELPYALEQGVCFDGSSIAGFMNTEESDLVLWPDPDTMTILPWRPTEGRVMRMYCDITLPNGRPFEGNCRGYLQSVIQRAAKMGLRCDVGCECEFYLFQTDEHGGPTHIPMDRGGYFDVAPLDKAENIRREICFAMADMGLRPQHSHHESGFGQNEVDFMYADALKSADNLNTFKTTVKAIADRNGLFASFMPKPLPDQAGSGLHVNVSLRRDGHNLLQDELTPDSEAAHFIAGILAHARELTCFCNPIPNSYTRFGSCEAPKYISWSRQNRSQLVRLPSASGEFCRLEMRSPDPAGNPYLVIGLILASGLDGIVNKLPLPDPVNSNLFHRHAAEGLESLPESLREAITIAAQSKFIAGELPLALMNKYFEYQTRLCHAYEESPDPRLWEKEHCFPMI